MIFIPLAFFFCAHQPTYCDEAEICTRYAEFSRQECFNNFIGFSTSYNREWWFLNSYICALILYPVIDRIVSPAFYAVQHLGGYHWHHSHHRCVPRHRRVRGARHTQRQLSVSCLFPAVRAVYRLFLDGRHLCKRKSVLIQLQDALRRNNLLHPVLDVFFIGVIIQLRSRLTEQTPDMIYVPFLHSILFGFAALYAAASLAAPAHRQGKHQHVAHSSVFLLLLLSRCKNSRCTALGHFVSARFTCAVLYRRAARPAVLAGHRQHDAAHTEDIS